MTLIGLNRSRLIDESGCVLPWLNREALEYLVSLDISAWDVFEWGLGYGTLWFQNKVKSITTTEHNKKWVDRIKLKNNVNLLIQQLKKCELCPYVTVINENKNLYDCIIIDGRNRVLCSQNVLEHLKYGGLIILDNSERKKYEKAVRFFNERLELILKTKIRKNDPAMTWETTIWKLL